MACPLVTGTRAVGFLGRSSREKDAYDSHQVQLQMAIAESISQSVEKAYRIEQLIQANHAYSEMLAFVSHELQSPIASMVTDARLLAGGYVGPLTEKQQEKLQRAIGKGEYLLGIVRDYLPPGPPGRRPAQGGPKGPQTPRRGARPGHRDVRRGTRREADDAPGRSRRRPARDLRRRGPVACCPSQPTPQRREVRQRGGPDPTHRLRH